MSINMTQQQATAEIFWTAFQSLKKKERDAVMKRFIQDENLREDLRYSLIIEERKREPKILLEDYLSHKKQS